MDRCRECGQIVDQDCLAVDSKMCFECEQGDASIESLKNCSAQVKEMICKTLDHLANATGSTSDDMKNRLIIESLDNKKNDNVGNN